VDTQDQAVLSQRRLYLVDEALDQFFRESQARAARIGAAYLALWQTLEKNTSGGKRLRPRMVMAVYDALGGTDYEAAARVGAAFELLHTALIVHDDVIDRDFVRRGIPNVSGCYRDLAQTAGIPVATAQHRGLSVAVIAGDLALSGAGRLIEHCGADEVTRTKLLDLLDESIFASAAGELVDVDFSLSSRVPAVDEVVEMERLKTAVYSFEAPLQAGAVLARAEKETVAALGEFGRNVGIAYQIVDDLLGMFGNEETTGKTTVGDLREGKRTVLISYASGLPDWKRVAPLVGNPDLSERDALIIKTMLDESGARSYAEGLANEFARRAREVLARRYMSDALRTELEPVVEAVLSRAR
jgi:geranylgeranyl diphosphate synthase type II